MVATSISSSPLQINSIFNQKPRYYSLNPQNQSPSILFLSPLALPAIFPSTRTTRHSYNSFTSLKPTEIWRISAEEFSLSDAVPVENSDQIVTTSDDGVSTVISVLLFIAFLGLSVLTIGVVYIAISDFLQKREREKFEKEEAAKGKQGGKKRKVRARAGPRGFGQKIDEGDDIDI